MASSSSAEENRSLFAHELGVALVERATAQAGFDKPEGHPIHSQSVESAEESDGSIRCAAHQSAKECFHD